MRREREKRERACERDREIERGGGGRKINVSDVERGTWR